MTAAITHRPTATVPPGYPAALTGAVPAMRAAKPKSSDTLSQGAITAPRLPDLASPKRAAADPGVADLWRRETGNRATETQAIMSCAGIDWVRPPGGRALGTARREQILLQGYPLT